MIRLRRKISKAVEKVRKSGKIPLVDAPEVNGRGTGTIGFIDVGSVGGLPDPWYRHAHRLSYLLSFEPGDEPHHAEYSQSLDVALWSKRETLPFYVYEGRRDPVTRRLKHHGSSLFRQNVDYVEANYQWLSKRGPSSLASSWVERSQLVEQTDISCDTLDSVLESITSIAFHFLKIDAQGAELEILRGAEELLSSTLVGLELELFVLPLYEGVPLIADVVDFLDGYGFELVEAQAAHGTFDSQHDCVFLHRDRMPAMRAEVERVYGIGR